MKKVLIILGSIFLVFFLCSLCCVFFWLLLVSSSSGSTSANKPFEQEIQKPKSGVNDRVAVINVSGTIMDGSEGFGSDVLAAPDRIISELRAAYEDENTKAIVMVQNTPGGTTIGAQKICDELRIVRQKKTVITYIESLGASGGYYIANCTNYIIANKEAITGSIGVLIQAMDLSGLYEKVGIKEKTLTNTRGVLKTGNDFFQDGSQTEKIYKTLLDESYDEFINTIVEGRKLSKENLSKDEILKLADGRIYSGKQAADNGLVDKVGNFDTAINYLVDQKIVSRDPGIYQYTTNDFFGELFGTVAEKFIPGYQLNEISKTLKPGIYTMYIFKY